MLLLVCCVALEASGCMAAHPNFTGLWQVADPQLTLRPDVNATETDYTAEAWAHLEEYHREWDPNLDDPAKFCVAKGMPDTLTSRARTYVTDIFQSRRRITMIIEFMDNYRIIHFDQTQVPAGVVPSNNGYSVARWEGKTLVIETFALKEKSVVGPMQRSDQMHISERWTLRDDPKLGKVLDIDMTVEDPKVFRHPVKARQVYKVAEAGAELNEYACADALWDDHVNSRLKAREAK